VFNYKFDKEKDSYKFHGIYRGQVVNNKDPMNAGRVKINVFSVFDAIPEKDLPWATLNDSFMGGSPNVGGCWVPDEGTHVWAFFENGDIMQPVCLGGAPANPHFPEERKTAYFPDNRGDPTYPENHVIKTKSGHVVELDDTDGNTKVRISHNSGTQIIMFDNGDMIERVVGDCTRIVYGNLYEYVKGDKDEYIMGHADYRARRIDLNYDKPVFNVSPNEQNSIANAAAIIAVTGTSALVDSPDTNGDLQTLINQGFPPDEVQEDGDVEEIQPEEKDEEDQPQDIPVACGNITSVDYEMNLSPNFKLKDVSSGALFSHYITGQNGFSDLEIVCNLKALCENVLEPLRAAYPGFRINSGFRSGSSSSQHNKGMAVDIQWANFSNSDYSEAAKWVAENIKFDQFILEHGKSIWFHISYDRTSSQRGQTLTYHPNKSPKYKQGLTNYYA